MRTRAKDRIRLANGDVMTLGEALDAARVQLIEVISWTAKTDVPKQVTRYYAREDDALWDVGQKLYESRKGR